jgi:outer membrane protein OmpA-like peptidoglycan-associated protein
MRGWIVAIAIGGGCRSAPSPAPDPIEAHSANRARREAPPKRFVVTDTDVEILDPIEFVSGSSALHPKSGRILDAIAATLRGNPSIKLVEVRAYGSDALTQFRAQVAAERAQAIVDQLIARGVDRKRLLADGAPLPPPGRSAVPVFFILQRDH